MKRTKLYLVGALISAAFLNGCREKDVVAPSVTNANQHPNGLIKERFIYSVHVVASSEKGARTEGLLDAEVTVSQNGKISSKKVGDNGMAIFEDLVEGGVTVFVKAAGFASMNVFGNLNSGPGQFPNNSNQTQVYSQTEKIILPKIGAGLQGRLTYDNDKDPRTSPIAAAGIKVRVKYNSEVQPNLYFATTGADGIFTFANLPEAAAGISVDSSITVGFNTSDTLQYFKVSIASPPTLTLKFGSVVQVGNLVLDTDVDKVTYSGVITGSLFGDFAFVDKSNLKATTNNAANEVLGATFPASPSPRFQLISGNAYTFIGTGGLNQSVADQFVDSLFAAVATNLDTIPALNAVAYGVLNKSFVVSIAGLGNTTRLPAFSTSYLATDIIVKLKMTTVPAGYTGKTEFTPLPGAPAGKFTFSGLPLGATYKLTAVKYVTTEVPGTGTEKRFKFELKSESSYSVNGSSFANGYSVAGGEISIPLGATQTTPEDIGIWELKY